MCGRFAQIYDDTALKIKFDLEDISERIQPKFNISPGITVNAVTANDKTNKLTPMLWGFSELHGKPLPSLIFNSRLETLSGGSHLGQYLVKHRCVIPVSGFYEWNSKVPYYIKGSSNEIMCLAGVFIHNETECRCSVVTTDSTGFLKNIHHRMPLILPADLVDLWLRSSGHPKEILLTESADSIVGSLDFYKVSPVVNDTSFESEECNRKYDENSLF